MNIGSERERENGYMHIVIFTRKIRKYKNNNFHIICTRQFNKM